MTNAVVPVLVGFIVLYGLVSNVDIFDSFVRGARDGIDICLNIAPTLIGMLTAIGMLRASGGLDLLCTILELPLSFLGIPKEAAPLVLVRPLSGGLAMGVFRDMLAVFGPDSYIGRVASVMLGSTETTLYTIAVYYSAVSIKNTRHTLPAALISDLTGFIMSAAAVRIFFGILGG